MGQWGMHWGPQLSCDPVCFGLPGGLLSYPLPTTPEALVSALPPSVSHNDRGEGWGQACVP